MPRSGIGAGSVPAVRPRRVGTGKTRVGVRRDRVDPPTSTARFEQRRRAGRPLAGTDQTVFPINETNDRVGHASGLGIQLPAHRPSDDVGHAAPVLESHRHTGVQVPLGRD